MNIVIVGDGKVGSTLCEKLSREGHNVTVIDNKSEALGKSTEAYDVIGIRGNGASYKVQLEAGVPDADLLIAATSTDELNMVCCLLAKKLGAKHTIARIRNPEYTDQLMLMETDLGLSAVINPELEAAAEISRLINFPSAMNIGSFAKGRVNIAALRIPADGPMVGKKLSAFQQKHGLNVLICAVDRDDCVTIPDGNFVLQANDKIHVAGSIKNLSSFLRHMGKTDHKIKSVLLIGGGRIAHYLTKMLIETGVEVKIIETSSERCMNLCENLPGALIIQGDGTEQELLDSEGISETDAVVSLTNMDEENLIISMYALYKGVPKVITKINRTGYVDIIRKVGLDSVVSPKFAAANQIVQYVRALNNTMGSKVDTLYRIVGDKAEALEFTVSKNTLHLGEKFKKVNIHKGFLIASIVRRDKLIIPHGEDYLQTGDKVVIVTTHHQISDLNDIFKD